MNYYFNRKLITNADVFPYIKGVHLKAFPLPILNNKIKMEIKLYQSSEKYVLRFKKKEGNRKDFIDKYKDISNLALKLLK